jgi:hypothetical protein
VTSEEIDRRLAELIRSQKEIEGLLRDLLATWDRTAERQRRRMHILMGVGLLGLFAVAVACLWWWPQ